MKSLTCVALLLVFLSLAGTPALAQPRRGMMPHLQLHAINPGLSLSAAATTPVQQQMREDYATTLIQAQHDILQQNPSGLEREDLAIGVSSTTTRRVRPSVGFCWSVRAVLLRSGPAVWLGRLFLLKG